MILSASADALACVAPPQPAQKSDGRGRGRRPSRSAALEGSGGSPAASGGTARARRASSAPHRRARRSPRPSSLRLQAQDPSEHRRADRAGLDGHVRRRPGPACSGIQPARGPSETPRRGGPPATRTRSTPVKRKKRTRLICRRRGRSRARARPRRRSRGSRRSRQGRPGRLLECGGEEHGGLEALADHREERHADQRPAGAARERPRNRVLEIAAEVARVTAHPDDHVGHRRRGDQRDQRLELLLLALRQVLVEHLQRDAEADAEETATPTPVHIARSESRGPRRRGTCDDDDDQRRLEALAEADHEGRKHALAPVVGSPSDHVWLTLHKKRDFV